MPLNRRTTRYVRSMDTALRSYIGIPAATHHLLRGSAHPTRSKSFHLLSKLTNASVGSDIGLDLGSGIRSRNSSTRELAKHISVAFAKSARTGERVCFTSTAKGRAARRARVSSKQLSSK